MNYEEGRLNTFGHWPTSAEVDPIRIAKAGFYYTGQGVEVQCFSCGGKISEWNYGDQVMTRHRRLDPQCPFVINPATSGNVALIPPPSYTRGTPGSSTNTSEAVSPNSSTSPSIESDSNVTNEDEIYKNDALRLLSFINWPVTFISRESLALAGFYHAGGGRVRCAWCGGELYGGWRHGDRPLAEHRRHFPHCAYARVVAAREERPFVPGIPVVAPNNITSTSATSPTVENGSQTRDAVTHNERILATCQGDRELRTLGVLTSSGTAKHQRHACIEARLASYNRWPSSLRQTPGLLAEAGFYYTGVEDQVRCFYCDGGLGRWEPEDSPWTEHARWFPDCGYVLLMKGRSFVEKCKKITNVGSPDGDGRNSNNNSYVVPGQNNSRVRCPVTEAEIECQMDAACARAALSAGLQPARVRKAIRRRLELTGIAYTSADALIDAALNEQLNEGEWRAPSPQDGDRRARDIIARAMMGRYSANDTFEENSENEGYIFSTNGTSEEYSENEDDTSRAPTTTTVTTESQPAEQPTEARPGGQEGSSASDSTSQVDSERELDEQSPSVEDLSVEDDVLRQSVSLEEENRLLKEARLCKVCMDKEVCVVFLPCGHLVSCASCGAGLPHCPLCRGAVKALVRAYLS